MSQAPHMPFFVDAYLADTTHLSTEEHGAYLLLLMAMWRRGGTVPDDDRDNARMVGLTVAKWRRVKERLKEFLVCENGELTQKRLKKEWDFVQKKREIAAQNGARGGRPANKENKDLAKADGSFQVNPEKSSHPHTHTNSIQVSNETCRADKPPASKPTVEKGPDAEAYRVGREVLGSNAGGVVTKLKAYCNGDWLWVTDILRQAQAKDNPREWVGAVLRHGVRPQTPKHILFPKEIYGGVFNWNG